MFRRMSVIRLALALSAMAIGSSTFAQGADSRALTCTALHNMVTAQHFIFINNPNFQDFIVADVSYCSGGGSAQIQLRSVPTSDNPECVVNYCRIVDGGLRAD